VATQKTYRLIDRYLHLCHCQNYRHDLNHDDVRDDDEQLSLHDDGAAQGYARATVSTPEK
jgi:hypothetical protein